MIEYREFYFYRDVRQGSTFEISPLQFYDLYNRNDLEGADAQIWREVQPGLEIREFALRGEVVRRSRTIYTPKTGKTIQQLYNIIIKVNGSEVYNLVRQPNEKSNNLEKRMTNLITRIQNSYPVSF